MKIFGLTITRTKAVPATLNTPQGRGGWMPIIREGFAGAWQQNIDTPLVDVLSHPTVFACISLISSDLSKMRCELVREEDHDVWVDADNPAFSPVLRNPNHFQTPLQFFRQWFIFLLQAGNTYVLLQRDLRQVVTRMYVLNPWRVRPLVAPDGSVFYELQRDDLATLPQENVIVPGSEIIHDRINPLFHDLIGISPLYAAGIPAILGLKIQANSAHFFGNGSQPGGVLTAPGDIDETTADRLKKDWTTNFSGANAGKVAVLGSGLHYEAMGQPADKSQLSEQWSAASQAIADAFKVPFYLVGGPMPNYNNIQAQTVQYFTQCIQPLAIAAEQVLDRGLGLAPDTINGVRYGTQFNIQDLLWMDSATMMSVIKEGIGAGVLTPNEGRAQLNYEPVEGGDTPFIQSQNVSLAVASKPPAPAPAQLQSAQPTPQDTPHDVPGDQMAATFGGLLRKELGLAA